MTRWLRRRRSLFEPLESILEDVIRDWRRVPRQRSLGGRVVEIAWDDVNVQVRRDIAQEQVVHVTRHEGPFDGSPDILDVPPVVRELVDRKMGEVGDVSTPKNNGHVPFGDGVPFEDRLADPAAVERTIGQIRAETTRVTALA
jgi:hypothetical protein